MVGPLGEKFTFLNSLGTTKISRSLRLSVYINVVLLIKFQNNLNYSSTSNIREVMRFYNLGHKTFETDFNTSGDLTSKNKREKSAVKILLQLL